MPSSKLHGEHIPIVGIAGGSGSGKSALAEAFSKQCPFPVTLFPLDWYYRDLSHLPLEERACNNFDCPSALDSELYLSHLQQIRQGETVEAPVYDFKTHIRSGVTIINPNTIILAEGALLFAFPKIVEILDLTVYLHAPDDICLLRRIQRDLTERGRTHPFHRASISNHCPPPCGANTSNHPKNSRTVS